VVFVKEGEKILEPKKILLLNDLSIDMRGSQGLYLSNKEISDSFNGLLELELMTIQRADRSIGPHLCRQILKQRSQVLSCLALTRFEPFLVCCGSPVNVDKRLHPSFIDMTF
jgi:hypothetical protein